MEISDIYASDIKKSLCFKKAFLDQKDCMLQIYVFSVKNGVFHVSSKFSDEEYDSTIDLYYEIYLFGRLYLRETISPKFSICSKKSSFLKYSRRFVKVHAADMDYTVSLEGGNISFSQVGYDTSLSVADSMNYFICNHFYNDPDIKKLMRDNSVITLNSVQLNFKKSECVNFILALGLPITVEVKDGLFELKCKHFGAAETTTSFPSYPEYTMYDLKEGDITVLQHIMRSNYRIFKFPEIMSKLFLRICDNIFFTVGKHLKNHLPDMLSGNVTFAQEFDLTVNICKIYCELHEKGKKKDRTTERTRQSKEDINKRLQKVSSILRKFIKTHGVKFVKHPDFDNVVNQVKSELANSKTVEVEVLEDVVVSVEAAELSEDFIEIIEEDEFFDDEELSYIAIKNSELRDVHVVTSTTKTNYLKPNGFDAVYDSYIFNSRKLWRRSNLLNIYSKDEVLRLINKKGHLKKRDRKISNSFKLLLGEVVAGKNRIFHPFAFVENGKYSKEMKERLTQRHTHVEHTLIPAKVKYSYNGADEKEASNTLAVEERLKGKLIQLLAKKRSKAKMLKKAKKEGYRGDLELIKKQMKTYCLTLRDNFSYLKYYCKMEKLDLPLTKLIKDTSDLLEALIIEIID